MLDLPLIDLDSSNDTRQRAKVTIDNINLHSNILKEIIVNNIRLVKV